MARYPELTQFRSMSTAELDALYTDLRIWASQLILELDSRDRQVDASPTTQIFSLTSVGEYVGAPIGGTMVYGRKDGVYYGWDAVTSTWDALN